MTKHRSLVRSTGKKLAADNQVGLIVFENVEGATVEVHEAQVDLVADDKLACRTEDAFAQGLAIVGLAEGEELYVGILLVKPLGDGDGAIARTVLGQDDLVGPAKVCQLLTKIHYGCMQDGFFIVDRNDNGDAGRDGCVVGHGRTSRGVQERHNAYFIPSPRSRP